MSREPAEPPRARITQQFRERDAIAYDLRCDAARITLRVREASTVDERAIGAWRVEARIRGEEPQGSLAAFGVTRIAAFEELAREWSSVRATRAWPELDWKAISQAMVAVRAL